jgi:hypothetical protein
LHRLTPFRRDLFSFMNYGSREGTLSSTFVGIFGAELLQFFSAGPDRLGRTFSR